MNSTGKNLKTIAANLPIELVDDVLHFHHKSNICVDNKFKNRIVPHTLSLEQLLGLERSDFEISPFHDDAIPCESDSNVNIRRDRSANCFENEAVDFSTIKALLTNAFGARADGSRPYPSGGAIFPVEVICLIFADKITGSPASGFYHYRSSRHILQPLRKIDSATLREMIYRMEMPATAAPAFALLYLGVVGKMLVKYRYRGYRYALMETGSMYHQADLVAQSLQLKNKLYSGFNDLEILKLMGLDNMSFLPLVVQSFGAGTCK